MHPIAMHSLMHADGSAAPRNDFEPDATRVSAEVVRKGNSNDSSSLATSSAIGGQCPVDVITAVRTQGGNETEPNAFTRSHSSTPAEFADWFW